MLKINFISNTEDKNKVDKIFAAVNYEKGLMELDLLNENIAKQDAIIANKKGVKTKEDIAAAKIKIIMIFLAVGGVIYYWRLMKKIAQQS